MRSSHPRPPEPAAEPADVVTPLVATPVKITSYPFSLGKIIPGATFASACVPLTQNVLPVQNDGVTPDTQFNSIVIQAHGTNTGIVYVCTSAAAPDLTNYTNVIGELTAGQTYPRSKEWANNRNISSIYIGAVNAADFVIASVDAF